MSHLSKFQEALTEAGFDAAVISDKVSQRYLSGFDFDDGYLIVTPNRSYLVTDFRYIEAARAAVEPEMTVTLFGGGQGLVTLASILSDHACRRVAIEEDTLSLSDAERMKKCFAPMELSGGASAILTRLRVHKDLFELQTIARAQEITDAAFTHILSWIKPEMTEVEVALELEFFMRKNGADKEAFQTIAISGGNTSRPHGVPRRCRLEKGFLTMDFGASVDGYLSDMTRTVVLGRADAEMKRLYNTVLTAQKEALAAAAEGVSRRELDALARSIIDGAGYAGCFGHSLGHGVGMHIHEEPRLSPGASADGLLERGHVVSVEPGIYIEGKYGCRIEDLICIRPDGKLHNFTRSPKELIELF